MSEKLREKILHFTEKVKKTFLLRKKEISGTIEVKKTSILRKIKIRQRIIIAFFIISILPQLILGLISFSSAKTLLSGTVKQYTEQTVIQFGRNISGELTKVTESTNSFLFSSFLQSRFYEYDQLPVYDKGVAYNEIHKEMTVIATQNKSVAELRLVSSGNSTIYVGTASDNIDYEQLNEQFTEGGYSYKWYNFENKIIYARRVVHISTNEWLGNFYIVFSSTSLNQLFDTLKFDDRVELLFLTENGTIVYSSDESKTPGTVYPYPDLINTIVSERITEDNLYGGFNIHLDENSYCNFYHFLNTPFYVVTVTPYSFINSAANTIGTSIAFTLGIAIILSVVLSIVISNNISSPLATLAGLMRNARSGDFTKTVTDNSKDEIGEVITHFDDMISNIKKLIEKVQISVNNVSASAEKIFASSEQSLASSEQIALTLQEVAKGSSEQAEEVSRTVEYMNDLSDSINKMTEKLSNMAGLIANTEETSTEAIERVKILNDRANQTKEASLRIVEELNSLNNDMRQIRKITKLIVGISDQTNLLSLNAAIEAARAGEAGRGFAVVADEVRKLADQTKEASIMINNIINEINNKTEHAVSEATNTSSIVQDQMAAVEQTNDAFNQITASMREIKEYMTEVENSVGDMLALRQKTLSAVENISAVSEEAAATSEEVSASTQEQMASAEVLTNLARELDKMAKELQSAVSMFKIN